MECILQTPRLLRQCFMNFDWFSVIHDNVLMALNLCRVISNVPADTQITIASVSVMCFLMFGGNIRRASQNTFLISVFKYKSFQSIHVVPELHWLLCVTPELLRCFLVCGWILRLAQEIQGCYCQDCYEFLYIPGKPCVAFPMAEM